ncbi:MAG: class II aldolase/adducin family protein [Synergistaceae bacterium]
MNSDIVLREKILAAGRSILEKRLVQGTGGNISARTAKGFLITPSGIEYQNVAPGDLVEMDIEGNVIGGTCVPSVEREMHRLIMASRPDVNAVIHTHSIYATSVASARLPLEALTDNQVAVFGGAVPLADYGPIGSLQLAQNAVRALGSGCGVLLSNHGSICTGSTITEALLRCEMLEAFARIYILAKIAGGGVPLSAEEISYESAFIKENYGQKK